MATFYQTKYFPEFLSKLYDLKISGKVTKNINPGKLVLKTDFTH